MILSFVALTAGCAATVSGDYCDIARPIWFDTSGDVLTTPADVRRQILVHNELWAALCE